MFQGEESEADLQIPHRRGNPLLIQEPTEAQKGQREAVTGQVGRTAG
jgi:hypothetical protein